MIEQVDWFLRPTDFQLVIKDSYPQPSATVTKAYLSSVEQILIKSGVRFSEEPPISASVRGTLSELVDLSIGLTYTPWHYPQEKTPLDSIMIVSNQDLTSVNQLVVVLFPDNGMPWADGTVKKPADEYVEDYTPVDHYLRLIVRLMDEMSEKGLLTPSTIPLERLFAAPP